MKKLHHHQNDCGKKIKEITHFCRWKQIRKWITFCACYVCVCFCLYSHGAPFFLSVCVSFSLSLSLMSLAACFSATWLEYHQVMSSLSPSSCGKPLLVLQWLTHTRTHTHTHTRAHTHTHTHTHTHLTMMSSDSWVQQCYRNGSASLSVDTLFTRCYSAVVPKTQRNVH